MTIGFRCSFGYWVENTRQESDIVIPGASSLRQPGEVTEIELKKKDGQYAYEVDLVDGNGVKRELSFDAKTGTVLAIEEDDDSEDDNSECDDECEEKG